MVPYHVSGVLIESTQLKTVLSDFAGDGLTSRLILNADVTLQYASPALGSGTSCMRWRPVKAPIRSSDSPFVASVVRRCPLDVEAMSSRIFPNGVA